MDWEEADDLAAVAAEVDVLYQTRIQKERFQVISLLQFQLGNRVADCGPATAGW